MILSFERRCYLIPEGAQVFDREGAVLATAQVVGGALQPLAGERPVDVSGRLLRRQVRARRRDLGRLAEEFGAQGEERAVAFARALDTAAARLTRAQVVSDRQQLRGLKLPTAVALELPLRQMLDQVRSNLTAGAPAALLTV